MANTNAPFGFKEDGLAGGASAPTAALVERQILYTDSAIFKGDPVLNVAGGYISKWVNGSDRKLLAGVFNGCRYLSLSQGKVVYSNYWPGSDAAAGTVFGYITPCIPGAAQQFYVQAASGPITFADIGQNADVTMGAGNTITGLSTSTLSDLGTAATLPFVITGLYPGVGNGSDPATAYNIVIVASNNAGAGGI